VIDYRNPGLNGTGSAAMITAYGTTPRYCKIEGWFNATMISVKCYPPTGG
jgi:hypothetical protein